MIFKIKLDNRTDYAQAKNQVDLLQNYESEFGELKYIEEVIEISEEEAKTIMLLNNEYNEFLPESEENFKYFSLYDSVCGNNFVLVGSTDWI